MNHPTIGATHGIPAVAERVAESERQTKNLRAVEKLERALWRYRSERKISGADDALLESIESFKEVFNAG